MSRKRLLQRAAVSALIFVMTLFAFILMLVSNSEGALILKGFENLKYFTLDSNLLMGVIALIDLIFCLKALKNDRSIPDFVEALYFTGTAAVTLTFLTVMAFLGPLYGYGAMLERNNLFFHLITPVTAIAGLCCLHRGRYISFKEILISIIPMFVYGIFYTSMILIYGLDYPRTDWYYFAGGGMSNVPAVIIIMLAAAFVISFLLRLACGGTKRGN